METIKIHIQPIEIEGRKVFTIRQFATIIERSEQTVLNLMHRGNKIRKLKFLKAGGKPYIFASELTEFPFTVSGKGEDIYYYNSQGAIDAKRSKISP